MWQLEICKCFTKTVFNIFVADEDSENKGNKRVLGLYGL